MNNYIFFLIVFFISLSSIASDIESQLLAQCSNKHLKSCELLATYYVKEGKLEKSFLLGDALCKKEVAIGCTIKGTSLISNKQIKEGVQSLNYSCDKFEPYACRSLGRLMKQAGALELSHVYFRKACHFGLKEICSDLKKDFQFITKAGIKFMESIPEDCSDTSSTTCLNKIKNINTCATPLTKMDCELIPSLLNIFFRSKLIQAEAKLLLNKVWLSQKKYKERNKKYSFNLSDLIKNQSHHQNYHYVFGFQKSCSQNSKFSSLDIIPKSYSGISLYSMNLIKKELSRMNKKDCYDPKWGFEVFAVSSLNPLIPENLDIWKINQDGNLIHIKDGSPTQ